MISLCSRKRSSLGCTSSGRSPISSRNRRAAGRRADQAGLVGDRAGERTRGGGRTAGCRRARASSSCSCRAGTSRRCAASPTWIARATSSLPVPLSPVISTVRSLPCSRWICSTTRAIAALAQTKPGACGSSVGSRDGSPAAARPRSRAAHSANPCRATAAIMRRRRASAWPIGRDDASQRRAARRRRRRRAVRRTTRARRRRARRLRPSRASARAASASHAAAATTRISSPPDA